MKTAIVRCFSPNKDEIGSYRILDRTDFEVELCAVENAFGVRLDRRKKYAVVNGVLCELTKWTQACSGCTPEYESIGYNHDAGGGCEECGYTGKRRASMWVPVRKEPRP